ALADLKVVEAESTEEPAPGAAESKEPIIAGNHQAFVRSNKDLLSSAGHASPHGALQELEAKIRLWMRQGFKILCFSSTQSQQERIRFLLEDRGMTCITDPSSAARLQPGTITLDQGSLSEGFRWPAE